MHGRLSSQLELLWGDRKHWEKFAACAIRSLASASNAFPTRADLPEEGASEADHHCRQAELGSLLRLAVPASLTVTGTASLIGGGEVTLSLTGKITPAGARPAITSVGFAGGPSDPSFLIRGNDLGALPKPDPPGHPSGLNGCPVVAGDTGYDYGTSLYLVGVSLDFSGGRYRPSSGETDCIDLVVTQFTESEIALHLGPFYLKFYKQFPFNNGEQVQFVVNGVQKSVDIKYGATVAS